MDEAKRRDARVTIRDIAEQADFSISTVSMVLNDAPLARYIRAATKKRIVEVARKLGYTPNQLARSLRSQRNYTVGVMVFDITDPFCTPILRGIESTLYQASYVSILTDAHNERSRFERYLEMLLERRVEGLIVVANWLLVNINLLADLEKRSIPTVVIGGEIQTESINSVAVDNETGARLILDYLYSLGHRKIAFLRGPKRLSSSGKRWTGVRGFAHSMGLRLDPKLVLHLPDSLDPNSSFEAGYELTEELLNRKREIGRAHV